MANIKSIGLAGLVSLLVACTQQVKQKTVDNYDTQCKRVPFEEGDYFTETTNISTSTSFVGIPMSSKHIRTEERNFTCWRVYNPQFTEAYHVPIGGRMIYADRQTDNPPPPLWQFAQRQITTGDYGIK